MSDPVPDLILAPGGGERCACCDAAAVVYYPEHGAWLCSSPPGECAMRGLELLMGPLPNDPADGPVLPGHLPPRGVRSAGEGSPDPAGWDYDAYL